MKRPALLILLLSICFGGYSQKIVKKGENYGFVNKKGASVLSTKYDSIVKLDNGYYAYFYAPEDVEEYYPEDDWYGEDEWGFEGEWVESGPDPEVFCGLISPKGLVTSCSYKEIYSLPNKSFFLKHSDGTVYMVDKKFRMTQFMAENIFLDGSILSYYNGEERGIIGKDGKVSMKGNYKTLVPIGSKPAKRITSGFSTEDMAYNDVNITTGIYLLRDNSDQSNLKYIISQGDTVGIKNSEMKWVVQPNYSAIDWDFSDKYALVSKYSLFGGGFDEYDEWGDDWGDYGDGDGVENYGLLNKKTLKFEIPVGPESINIWDDNLLYIAHSWDSVSLYQDLDLSKPMTFQSAVKFGDKYIKVKINKKYGLIDKDLNWVLQPEYSTLYRRSDYITAKKDWKNQGLFRYDDCSKVLPTKYKSIYFGTHYIKLTDQSNKTALVKKSDLGQIEPKFVYDFVQFNRYGFLAKKDGKYGILDPKDLSILLPFDYSNIRRKSNYVYECKKNGKQGAYSARNKKFVLDMKYDKVTSTYNFVFATKGNRLDIFTSNYETLLGSGNYDNASLFDRSENLLLTEARGRKGLIKMTSKGIKVVLENKYKDITKRPYIGDNNLVRVKQGSKWGLFDFSKEEFTVKPLYDSIAYKNDEEAMVYQGGKVGAMNLQDKKIHWFENFESTYRLKWKAYIGKTSYRTNIIQANISGKGEMLIVGSNGKSWTTIGESTDGVYIINPKTGKVITQINPEYKGDMDVCGVAVDGDKLFFGTDEGLLYCYNNLGGTPKKVWEYKYHKNIENTPALADLNGDGVLDVVINVRGTGTAAVNGKDGKELWSVFHNAPRYDTFMGAPGLIDLNGDNVEDVVVGAHGYVTDTGKGDKYHPYVWALNGKTGEYIWLKKLNGWSRITGSPFITNKGGQIEIMVAPVDGDIHVLNGKGEIIKQVKSVSGKYSHLVRSPDMKYVFSGISLYRYHGIAGGPLDGENAEMKSISELGNTGASPVIFDIDDNGVMEVIANSEDGDIVISDLTGKAKKFMIRKQGGEATMFVKDVDKDGYIEMVIADSDGYIRCYATKSKAGKIFRGQYRANNRNTGVYEIK